MSADHTESFGSVSLVRQGAHRFYSLTIPSDTLAKSCYIISRDEDPALGFQRMLDKKRAMEIATYIDSGMGTIPSSIVLSAQEAANLEYDSKRKTIKFDLTPKSFLIIDGQHRVYGFMLAKTALRVPVVIYDGLSRRDESRLFIDINSKQKGVPPELLLDIKKLAEYENTQEEFLREVFDLFEKDRRSVLLGKLSPFSKKKGSLTRSTVNAALKPLLKIFGGKESDEVFDILNNYVSAFGEAILSPYALGDQIVNTAVFKAMCSFFNVVASKVKDKYGPVYSVDNFYAILEPAGKRVKISKLKSPGIAYRPIVQALEESLKDDFTL